MTPTLSALMPSAKLLRSVLMAALMLSSSCARQPPEIVLSGPTMGTMYTVRVVAAPVAATAATIRAAIDEVLSDIDRQMSGYRSDSELSRFNASASTEWFTVSEDLARVVAGANEVSEATQGALDVTVAPLVALWGFGPSGPPGQLPSQDQLREAQRRVGFRKLQVRTVPPALRKQISELSVDVNGVAPGYATDRLVERLSTLGIRHCMVDIGGEIAVRGLNARGKPWRIAVEQPVDGESEPYAVIELSDRAVTTSGEYRRTWELDGKRYSHTIDPRTGRPVRHALASVVVIADTAMQADAWATALNVLGEEAGYALALQRQMPVLFITARDGRFQSRMTPTMQSLLIKREADSG